MMSVPGLETIHLLTLRKPYELRLEMEDFEGTKVYVHYSSFSVGPEAEGYKLSVSGFKDGGAGELNKLLKRLFKCLSPDLPV